MTTSLVTRRHFIGSVTAGLAVMHAPGFAQVAWKAEKPIRFIVPYAAGGPSDIVARALAQSIGDKLGQPIVVDNKPGVSGAVGSQLAYQAPPDGHTIIVGASDSHAVYPHVYAKPIFKADEFTPIGPIGVIPFVLMARQDLEANTAPEVIALAKKRQLTYASWGIGSAGHLSAILLMRATGLPTTTMLHVPYSGAAPAAQAVSAGQVELIVAPVPLVAAQRGKMKAIALIHPSRVEAVGDIPTLAEQGIKVQMDAENWMGVLAPPKTPAYIVNAFFTRLNEALATPEIKTRWAGLGIVPQQFATPTAYAEFYHGEFKRWGKVIQEAGVKLD